MPVTTLNGTTLFYEVAGDGEPLVLVHGAWVDHRACWEAVVGPLAESFRVVTYDLRGHGRSVLDPPDAGTVHDDVGDLVALIEHLELERVNVGGISSGACIALRFAIEHPELVHCVLPHEPPCMAFLAGLPEAEPVLEVAGAALSEVASKIVAGDHRGAAERFADGLDVGIPWSEMTESLRETFTAHAVPFLGQLNDPDAVALDADALHRLEAPVLLSEGAESPRVARLVVDQLAAMLPNAHRSVIDEAGHIPQMTHPDRYVAMVEEFIGTRVRQR